MELDYFYNITRLFEEAIGEFYLLEIEIPNKDEKRWSNVGEILRKIDPFAFKWNIDVLLIDKEPERLFKFLNENFIKSYDAYADLVWDIVENEKIVFDSGNKNFTQRQKVIDHLAGLFQEIFEIIREIRPSEKGTIKSFKSKLDKTQLEKLFDNLISKKYIDQKTSLTHFLSVFHEEIHPDVFTPVKWLLGKNVLRELLEFISGYENQANKQYLPTYVVNIIIPELFIDKENKKIILNKPKKLEYSRHYTEIQSIIKDIH